VNNVPNSQCTLSDMFERLRRSDVIRMKAHAHENTEQLVNDLNHAETSVLLKLCGLQSH
jgi:hypothetical protein